MRRLLLPLGTALVLAAALWPFLAAPRWTRRIPPGWHTGQHYTGTSTWADPVTKRLPAKDEIMEYVRSMRADGTAPDGRSVIIQDRYAVLAFDSDSVTWEYVTRQAVDPRTGALVDPRYAGDVAVFPRNTQPQTYRLRTNYLKGLPLAFARVDTVEGLETYLFAYQGGAEYTESYLGTPQYPGIKVPPGHEIRCRDDQFRLRIWVEPVTGSTVKLEEGCPSGDYFYDRATNRPVEPVDRWGGVTAGDALVESVRTVRAERSRVLWMSRYLPLLAGLAGALLVVAGLLLRPVSAAPSQPAARAA